MFDQVEVNFKSLKLIKKCKNTTTTKTKNLTLNTFFKQCWVCECSTASNAVLLCFSHMSWMDFLVLAGYSILWHPKILQLMVDEHSDNSPSTVQKVGGFNPPASATAC